MIPSCSSIQDQNTQAQTFIQSEEASSEVVGVLTGTLDPLERAAAILDKVWETIWDVSSPLDETFEWSIGILDAVSEGLEVKVRDLEARSEDPEALREAREPLIRAVKVLKKSQEPFLCRVPSILAGVPRAIQEVFPDEESRIVCAKDKTLKIESTAMVSHAKCGSCLVEALEAGDKEKQGVSGSAQLLAKSLQGLTEALRAHAEFQNDYVESIEALGALTGSLDPLERAEVSLDKVWDTLFDVSFPLEESYESDIGALDAMVENLEVEIGNLETPSEDQAALSEAREFLIGVLKVLKKSREPFLRRVPLILGEVPRAKEVALRDDGFRIVCAEDETLKAESPMMVSYSKCGRCLLETLQARDKAKQGGAGSAQALAKSLRGLAEALLTYAAFQNDYVESVERLALELERVIEIVDVSEFKQQGIDFINNHLLNGLTPITREAFLQVDSDAFHFFIFLAYYFYTVGPLKKETIPSFFFQETRKEIQSLREEFSSVVVDLSFKPVLEDFEKFNNPPDSIKNSPLFTELRASSSQTLQMKSDRFVMCWRAVVMAE